MFKSKFVMSAFAILLPMLSVSVVQASPIRVDFNGTILPGSFTYNGASGLDGNWDNRSFTGSIIFDPAAAAYDYTNPDSTFRFSSDNYNTPHPYMPWMRAVLSLPDGVIISGDHSAEFQSLIQLYRNYSNPLGTNALTLNVSNVDNFPHYSYFSFAWEVIDHSGTASTLLSNINAGLSYTQPINLAGQMQFGGFNLQAHDADKFQIYSYQGEFILSSIEISSIPEPSTFALLGLGLIGLGFNRSNKLSAMQLN